MSPDFCPKCKQCFSWETQIILQYSQGLQDVPLDKYILHLNPLAKACCLWVKFQNLIVSIGEILYLLETEISHLLAAKSTAAEMYGTLAN